MKTIGLPAIAASVAVLLSVGWAGTAQALPVITNVNATLTTYFGETNGANGQVTGDPVDARSSFAARLSGVSTETFESFTAGDDAPIVLGFAGSGGSSLKATLSGSGEVFASTNLTVDLGRFNTTGANATAKDGKWFETGFRDDGFVITFDTAISAFGFYGTDIGDFDGQVTLALENVDGAITNLTIPNTRSAADASLLFWGFIDDSVKYKKISFGNTDGQDIFGFDDMVVGDQDQIAPPPTPMPEPGSLALVGLSLLALTATRRRRG